MKPAITAICTVAALIIIAQFGWDIYRGYRVTAARNDPTFRIHASDVRQRNPNGEIVRLRCPACAGTGRDAGYGTCARCYGMGQVGPSDHRERFVEVADDQPTDYPR